MTARDRMFPAVVNDTISDSPTSSKPNAVALLRCEAVGEVLHDKWIGIQRGKGLAIGFSPATKPQPGVLGSANAT
jgi:hypothetical protein